MVKNIFFYIMDRCQVILEINIITHNKEFEQDLNKKTFVFDNKNQV